ncbi:hypothetical protein F2P81_000403 [Scophthalmus maximus]|uniref:Uncharacterized protein n=1 Tax=Scophthalmus maximus TaxID=52904 RepID=A0A6A4TT34_SCOMX|nr:hypothetical protein F2P81_000403 [Scophthalmus maximus]
MDKRLLLVMLCLQVFLLITTFTSTDAAALEKDDRLQPIDENGTGYSPAKAKRSTHVFLLITTFTSTDAAALEKDDRLQPIDENGTGYSPAKAKRSSHRLKAPALI